MRLTGAIVRQADAPMAVVIVEREVLARRRSAERALKLVRPLFPGLNVVLTARDGWGRHAWYARAGVTPPSALLSPGPVNEFTVIVEESPDPGPRRRRPAGALRRERGRRGEGVAV